MRKEKQLLLDEVKEQMNQYGSFLIMSYTGLTANRANNFRREVAQLGGNVEILRKRLLIKAAQPIGIELDPSILQGHIGLVFGGSDPIELTKLVFTFSQNNEQSINVIGGRFEGKLYSGEQMKRLSELPGKDEMRAQFLATLEAPMSHTLSVMNALLTSVIYCLDNKGKEQEKAE